MQKAVLRVCPSLIGSGTSQRASSEWIDYFHPTIVPNVLQQGLVRDTTFTRSDCFLEDVDRRFLFAWKPRVDAVDENVGVNELRHGYKDDPVSSRGGRV